MKTLLIAVGGLLLLVVVVAVIGYALPKGHVSKRAAVYSRPPEVIWSAITDFAGQARWRTDLKTIEQAPAQNGKPVWREIAKNGDAVPYETTETDPPRRLVRTIADPKLPFGGRWIYELAPTPSGTRLTITEEGEVYNPVFRVVSRFMDMGATATRYLEALGASFGEQTAVEKIEDPRGTG